MELISSIPTEIKSRERSYYSEPFDGDTGEKNVMFFREISRIKCAFSQLTTVCTIKVTAFGRLVSLLNNIIWGLIKKNPIKSLFHKV